ncbi:MAG: nicotinamide-nucleotide amidohydrolase family protein [Thermaerobacter sp.]|nr:nicotinamide-nucleotide amidohydrolase family protein [Thermaerobacter sp.]
MISTACIIAVGDEVLTGEIANTNSAFVADRLLTAGVRPRRHLVVGDDPAEIRRSVQDGLAWSDLVVMIGGLGPTPDDVTKDAVADALGRQLISNPELASLIAARHGRNVGWEESVARQARVVEGAILWPNSAGTAPGQVLAASKGWVVLLPGPPAEMAAIVEAYLVPWLTGHASDSLIRETYRAYDDGESAVSKHIDRLLRGQHPHTGLYARPGEIQLRLESRDTVHGRLLVQRAAAWARGQYPHRLYRFGRRARSEILLQELTRRSLQVAAMESLTGGMLLSRLIEWPGASLAVAGGSIAYTDAAKIAFGVPPQVIATYGAVSGECALAMADAARAQTGADIGMATTGYAGPSGGTPGHPVGTVFVAVTTARQREMRHRLSGASRTDIRHMAVEQVLTLLWEVLGLAEDMDAP